MTIKGKKKQQSRGSQARRRPASAPRPVVTTGAKRASWHRTPTARVVGALVLVLLLSAGAAWVTNIRNNAREADRRRDALATYTGKIRSLIQDMTAPAGEMAAAPAAADAEGFKGLEKDAKSWQKSFQTIQSKAIAVVPAEGTENANVLFQQALRMYSAAAATYALAPEAGAKLASDILARAAEQRDQAASLWQSATDVLDGVRAEEGMNASGLRPPAQAPAQGLPPGLEEGLPPGLETGLQEGLQEGELPGGEGPAGEDAGDEGRRNTKSRQRG